MAIDTDRFSRALEAGALDACLEYLRRDEIAGAEAARLACRLGERLYWCGRGDEALECGRLAFTAAADDSFVADFCAWLFSNCGCYADAADAYERLIARRPDWIEGYRHASGALAAAGDAARAIDYAIRASEHDPRNFEYAFHAGCLLLNAQRVEEAALYLTRALAIAPDDPRALKALSAAGHSLDRFDEALALALRAAAAAPDDGDIACHAAELLLRAGHVADALDRLYRALARNPADAVLWRLASTGEAERDEIDAALAAIDRALELAPRTAEYHLHRAHLLRRRGDLAEAFDAVERAAALDPDNPSARRAQLDFLAEAGELTEATALGGDLLRAFPQDEAAAEAVLHVLNRRLDTIDGDYVVLGDNARRVARRDEPEPRLFERLRSQMRVIHALIIRETRTRFGDSRLGYGWALIEPILHIALLSAVFSLLMHGSPPIGTHFFIFYYTGIIPYHVFVHTSASMMHGVTSNGSLLQLPPVKPFDVILARGLLEFVTDIAVAAILLIGFAAAGLPAMPDDLWSVATALAASALLGCGAGFVNAVLQTVTRSWDKLWNNATRLLYFFSGIFYVPGMMPDWARDILAWNPLLHAIDWFRAGFFAGYRPHWLDRGYLTVTALSVLLAGLALERGLRRRLSEPT